MGDKLKIGIVEDEAIIADVLCEMLTAIGYSVPEPAAKYSEAIDMITRETPDLLLLDIHLTGQLDGIDVAHTVVKKYNIPFIFLTAHLDASTIQRAKEVFPAAYLAKPITRDQLYSAIEIALSNFNNNTRQASREQTSTTTADAVFVKDGYAFRKVMFDEIIHLNAEANYVAIHLADEKKIMVRATLDDFIAQLNNSLFIRIHRSYAVNSKKIEGVFPNEVKIKNVTVPVGKAYKEELFRILGIPG